MTVRFNGRTFYIEGSQSLRPFERVLLPNGQVAYVVEGFFYPRHYNTVSTTPRNAPVPLREGWSHFTVKGTRVKWDVTQSA